MTDKTMTLGLAVLVIVASASVVGVVKINMTPTNATGSAVQDLYCICKVQSTEVGGPGMYEKVRVQFPEEHTRAACDERCNRIYDRYGIVIGYPEPRSIA